MTIKVAIGDPLSKPNLGVENGACNNKSCQTEPALWYNHADGKWYCGSCAHAIGADPQIRRYWMTQRWPSLGHHQFETRADMDRRASQRDIVRHRSFAPRITPVNNDDHYVPRSRFIRRYGRHRKDHTST